MSNKNVLKVEINNEYIEVDFPKNITIFNVLSINKKDGKYWTAKFQGVNFDEIPHLE